MGGSSFDLIAQELQEQQRIMGEMKAENYLLRQQVSDLRNGRGIFLEINGAPLELASLWSQSAPLAETSQPEIQSQVSTSIPETLRAIELKPLEPLPAVAEVEQTEHEEKDTSVPERQRSTTVPLADTSATKTSTFLEEIMLDEFRSALTAPNPVWHAPQQTIEKPELSADEKKATLRRELMGSFLLE